MARKRKTTPNDDSTQWYRGGEIPMRVIRRYAQRVGERFQPEKIILFGSYAYGKPNADSDVDLLVIMPARNELDQAFKIRCEVPAQFPMDLVVLKPQNLKWRLEECESFVTEIMTNGKTLYEKNDSGVDTQGRGRLSNGRSTRRRGQAVS